MEERRDIADTAKRTHLQKEGIGGSGEAFGMQGDVKALAPELLLIGEFGRGAKKTVAATTGLPPPADMSRFKQTVEMVDEKTAVQIELRLKLALQPAVSLSLVRPRQ